MNPQFVMSVPLYRPEQDVLHADETTLQVLWEPGKTAQSKSCMWLHQNLLWAKRYTMTSHSENI